MENEIHELPMQWMTMDDVLAKTVSYAQNYEDILLGRVFPKADGFYVDIGANHPVFHSVTKLFYDRGWQGINAEPSPVVFRQLAESRPRDVNLNVGLGSSIGMMTFYETLDRHGWSTFRHDLRDHYLNQGLSVKEIPIHVTTLKQVCEEHVNSTIDFLKIDAEGFEREILLGADFEKWRPRVMVIENAWPESWEPLLDGLNYLPAAFDGLNRFYVRVEDKQLLSSFDSTANVLDNFVPYELLRLLQFSAGSTKARTDGVIHSMRDEARRVLRGLKRRVRYFGHRAS